MKYAFTLLMLFLGATSLFAQKQEIHGKVFTISNGEKAPAPYAAVIVLEKSKFHECNEKGEFTLPDLQDGIYTITASYVGFASDTICLEIKDGTTTTLAGNGNVTPNNIEFTLKSNTELDALVVTGKQAGNYLSKSANIKTEVISSAGLCKMACCSLAESFENSASVTVGFSDAVSGARQIRLLGLSGTYTQMLDETRPVMKGLASPFGLDYIPGQWLESIQIGKGPSSVINGLDAITGQINLEHRKPTAENPLFVNLFVNSNARGEANIASSLQLNDKWYTVIMAHASKDTKKHDMNNDGFRDDPLKTQLNFDNRWLYQSPSGGAQIRFGIKGILDTRIGGQMDFKKGMNDLSSRSRFTSGVWGSQTENSTLGGYLKVGIPLANEGETNIAIIADYSYYDMKSSFGNKYFNGYQNMGWFNLISQNRIAPGHKLSAGLNAELNDIHQDYKVHISREESYSATEMGSAYELCGRNDNIAGGFAEYTYDSPNEKLSIIAGIRADYHSQYKQWWFAPRVTFKYSITDKLILRANGGRGIKSANVVTDNLGILSSGRQINLEEEARMEDAWTFGGNLTQYFKLGYGEESYFSIDYFHTNFSNQLIVDWDKSQEFVSLYNCHGKSFTNTWQADLSLEPVERLTAALTFRYTSAKVDMDGQGLVDRPLMSKYKGVLNLQYATNLQKWIFDFTAQMNGPVSKPQFIGGGESNRYGMLYFQVTKKFRGLDLYAGVENITDYTQKEPIIDAANPYSWDFNAAMVWAPLMGRMYYFGLRLTLWR